MKTKKVAHHNSNSRALDNNDLDSTNHNELRYVGHVVENGEAHADHDHSFILQHLVISFQQDRVVKYQIPTARFVIIAK